MSSIWQNCSLPTHVEVKAATLANGLLHVDLVREIPEQLKPRQIPIGTSAASAKVIDAKTGEAKAAPLRRALKVVIPAHWSPSDWPPFGASSSPAPSYLARYGRPQHPDGLTAHPCRGYAYRAKRDVWRLTNKAGDGATVPPVGPLRVTNVDVDPDAARAGLAVAELPEFIAFDLLRIPAAADRASGRAACDARCQPRQELARRPGEKRRNMDYNNLMENPAACQ